MNSLAGAEFLTPAGASVAALMSLRIGAVFWVAPVFSARVLPMPMKAGLAVLMTVLLWHPPAAGSLVQVTTVTVLSELLIGMTLGLGAGIFVAAAEASGDMVAVQMGLSGANVVDPMSQTQLPVIGQYFALFVTALILATGGHLAILGAMASSFHTLPVAAPIDFAGGIWAVVGLGGTLLWLGLRFAAPVIGALMISNAALGIMSRAVPQLNVLVISFPVQIAVGLFVLVGTIPLIALVFQDWPAMYMGLAADLLDALTPAAGQR